MLSYAFQTLREEGYRDVGTEEFKNVGDLCSAILIKGMNLQIRRGLKRDYIPETEVVSGIKGRLDISASIKMQTMVKRQMVCSYDEYSLDTYFHRIIKTTLLLLLHGDILPDRKKAIKNILGVLSPVEVLDVHTIDWKQNYNRNNQSYQMLISICYLVIKGLLQTTENGKTRLMGFLDEQRMCRLYEKFILEYFRQEYPSLNARASHIKWVLDDGYDNMLPLMKSDITLSYGDKILILDAKYYDHTTQVQYDVHTLHSANIYQIFTYVKNKQDGEEGKGKTVSGMLLYARTDEEIQPHNDYLMSGNRISVRTLDLSGGFESIENQLGSIVRDVFGDF